MKRPPMFALRSLPRALMMFVVALALLGGLGSGLARLGFQMDALSQSWILVHGPLMIGGFMGTLICLERAVALASRYRWSMVVPVINAIGAAALLISDDVVVAKLLLTIGSLGLVVLFGLMLKLHPSRDMRIMAAGALCWLVGNLLWLSGQPIYQVVHLWTAFLILTIVGERLELSRVRRLSQRKEKALELLTAIYLSGVVFTIFHLDMGIRLLGVGAVLMAIWLFRYDIARRTVLQTGLPRYIASCLLAGYAWLAFGGILAIWKGAVIAGPDYAVVLHAFLLGFVFSMIFGHAPIILPALTGLKLNYTPVFYGHLLLLHGALVYRTYGNLTMNHVAWQLGALLNVVSILHNIRSLPGIYAEKTGQLNGGEWATILAGPICDGGYRWWQIRKDSGLVGWTVDGGNREAWLYRDDMITPTIAFTPTPSMTFTPSPTYTPSNTPTPTLSPTPSKTPTPSRTPSPTFTRTPSPSPTPEGPARVLGIRYEYYLGGLGFQIDLEVDGYANQELNVFLYFKDGNGNTVYTTAVSDPSLATSADIFFQLVQIHPCCESTIYTFENDQAIFIGVPYGTLVGGTTVYPVVEVQTTDGYMIGYFVKENGSPAISIGGCTSDHDCDGVSDADEQSIVDFFKPYFEFDEDEPADVNCDVVSGLSR